MNVRGKRFFSWHGNPEQESEVTLLTLQVKQLHHTLLNALTLVVFCFCVMTRLKADSCGWCGTVASAVQRAGEREREASLLVQLLVQLAGGTNDSSQYMFMGSSITEAELPYAAGAGRAIERAAILNRHFAVQVKEFGGLTGRVQESAVPAITGAAERVLKLLKEAGRVAHELHE